MPHRRKYPWLARVWWGFMALLVFCTFLLDVFNLQQSATSYALSAAAEELLPTANAQFAEKIKYDSKTGAYTYNTGYTPSTSGALGSGGPYFTASVAADISSGGVSVTDPESNITLKIIPQFATQRGEQSTNRLVYPLAGRDAQKVYTLGASGVKEDIILNKFQGNSASFDYKLELPSGTEARLLNNGGLGIYGVSSTLLGNITTGTQEDADLLEKARQNGAKTNLLFTLPAPYVKESGVTGVSQQVMAKYAYKDKILTVDVNGLAAAKYPLTIDPTIYITTAANFMQGNNDTNIEFDGTNDSIKKGKTTGARINAWTPSLGMPTAEWDGGSVAANGYVYNIGGATNGTAGKYVYNAAGSRTFTVPTGVTSLTVKLWGGGGGGGAGGAGGGTAGTNAGGAGGGGGYVTATLAVTAGEVLNIDVGAGGSAANENSAGGSGGGYSAIRRSSTMLLIAGGGGGGGGNYTTGTARAGGPGGGTNGTNGAVSAGTGGYGATGSTGGNGGATQTGGVIGSSGGSAGTLLNSGGDAGGSGAACSTSIAGNRGGGGGIGGGGKGGNGDTTTCTGGGGGGGGYGGGGGGGSTSQGSARSAGGGGGGSSYAATGSTTAGSGVNPGSNADTDLTLPNSGGTAGTGGAGGVSAGAAVDGLNGVVSISYTMSSGPTATTKVYWAQFDPSTSIVQSPAPGSDGVACTSWCNNSAYDLPAARRALTVVAYNGFLYALGGLDTTPSRTNTVYIAKLGANGEPQKWHPTDSNKANWVYWYPSTVTLPDSMAYTAAVTYNNGLYLFGGQTTTTPAGDTRVWRADILPTGDIGSWTTTGMQAIPNGSSSGRYGHGVQVYNDTLYIIGGRDSGNNFRADVWYSKLNSDGTMNSWTQTNGFTTGRMSMGGNMTAVWGGYIYLSGGCTAVNGSGYCTAYATDVRLASINADGSVGQWGTVANITNQMLGGSTLTWQNALYRVGGCASQNTSTGSCDTLLNTVDYGTINPDGDASTVSNSFSANSGTCSGATPYNCDLPGSGTDSGSHTYAIGQMSSMIVINNGYIYNIGGCTTNACTTMSNDTAYAVLNSDGTMGKPSTCSTTTGGYVTNSLWCVVDTTNTLNGTTGIGAGSATVFNGRIYIVGGTSGAANGWTGNIFSVALNNDGSLASAWTSQAGGTSGTGLPTTTFPNISSANGIGYGYAFTRANPASAGTNPGYLYYIGGCVSSSSSIGCTDYSTGVYRCTIASTGLIGTNTCSTSNQMQIDADGSATANVPGLGLMAGTVYANRIYLVGGACTQTTGTTTNPCGSAYSGNRKDTIYAKIDNNGFIVDNSTGLYTGSWAFTTAQMSPVRRRAISFGYNGYLYSLAGYSGSSSLRDLLFAKINVSTGNLDSPNWNSSGVVVTPRWDLRAIVSNGYVYAIGGCANGAAPTCSALQPQIQTFQLYNNDSGAAASYSSGTSAAATRIGGSATILNGYIYYAGGCTNIGCTTFTDEVDYAPIDAYGTIGSWTALSGASAGKLPAALAWGKLVSVGSTLYYVGGQSGNATTTAVASIYYTSSFSSGAPTSWTSVTSNGAIGDTASQAAQPRTQAGVAAWNNRIYVVGGYSSGGAVQSTVYISPDLSAGGSSLTTDSWLSSANTINVARAGAALVAYANNLYMLGGFNGTNYLMDTQFASLGYKTGTIQQSGTSVTGTGTSWSSSMAGSTLQYPDGTTATVQASPAITGTTLSVNVSRTLAAGTSYVILDGSVGSWTPSTSLPGPLRDADGFAANGYLYVLGGRSAASTCTPSTLVTPISANTTIASGNNPTGIGEWYETNQRYVSDRYGAGIAYANGRAYIMGGGCAALVSTGTDWLDYATLKSQPQVAKYSRMIDTDTDVFASMWLANGVDYSTGARWSLKYRSMNDPKQTNSTYQCGGASMPTWGQETNFGPIQLAKPGVYTPKNSGGSNINCSRFYYLSFSIDASQSFGYPEDNDRGPYISDISLYYTASASGRLLHGKTFSGGLQQPLDTPCSRSNNSSDPNYAACPNP